MNSTTLEEPSRPTRPGGESADPPPSGDASASESAADFDPSVMSQKLGELPKDVGVMLVAVGACGMVLPGMMGGPAILAGGLVLWPKAFGRVESWFERKFPKAHREGMRQIGRYLDDLDRRYSYSAGTKPDANSADLETPRSETP